MLATNPVVHLTLLALSGATTLALAGYAWRLRTEPGATAFAALMVSVTVWTGCYLAGLLTLHPRGRLFWEASTWFGIVTIPVFFFAFALQYTGHDEVLTPRTLAALSVVPVVSIVMAWTNQWHHLLWQQNQVVVVDRIALASQTFGPWFWVNLVYSYALIAVGSFLLVRLAVVSDYLYADQSVLLGVGILAPLAGNAASIFGYAPLPGFDLTPYAFTVTGLAFGAALFRSQLFELVPATRLLGRSAAIRDLEDGVVIVDSGRRIVYLNPAAASVFDVEQSAALGEPVRSLLDPDALDFDAVDALAEVDHGGRTYEVRTSPIADRQDRRLGHTLLVTDVTNRKRREQALERQREQLAALDRINSVIRDVNQALVAAPTRSAIESTVAERLADSDLYRAAWVGRGVVGSGDPVRWTAAAGPGIGGGGTSGDEDGETSGDGSDDRASDDDGDRADVGSVDSAVGEGVPAPAPLGEAGIDLSGGDLVDDGDGHSDGDHSGSEGDRPVDGDHSDGDSSGNDGHPVDGDGGDVPGGDDLPADGTDRPRDRGSWTAVPLSYEQVVYGVLVLSSDRPGSFDERELSVLDELGETIGHAIDAVESKQLVTADTVLEVEFAADGEGSVLAAASAAAEAPVEMEGLVPTDEERLLAYLSVDAGVETLESVAADREGVEHVRAVDAEAGLFEVALSGDSLLVPLSSYGANVTDAQAADGEVRVTAEVAADADVRSLSERVARAVPGADLFAKRELDRPMQEAAPFPAEVVEDLTDRQRETLEAAYRAGYFDWPRDSTAEDVAESMDVSPPTLHHHLRRAQNKVLTEFFDAELPARDAESS